MEGVNLHVLPEPVGVIPFARRHQPLRGTEVRPQEIDGPCDCGGAAPVHAEDTDSLLFRDAHFCRFFRWFPYTFDVMFVLKNYYKTSGDARVVKEVLPDLFCQAVRESGVKMGQLAQTPVTPCKNLNKIFLRTQI